MVLFNKTEGVIFHLIAKGEHAFKHFMDSEVLPVDLVSGIHEYSEDNIWFFMDWGVEAAIETGSHHVNLRQQQWLLGATIFNFLYRHLLKEMCHISQSLCLIYVKLGHDCINDSLANLAHFQFIALKLTNN